MCPRADLSSLLLIFYDFYQQVSKTPLGVTTGNQIEIYVL